MPALHSLKTASFDQLCRLRKDHVEVGDWCIMVDGFDTVWLSKQKLGEERTDHIEIPRKVFNKLVAGYLKPRKAVRK